MMKEDAVYMNSDQEYADYFHWEDYTMMKALTIFFKYMSAQKKTVPK